MPRSTLLLLSIGALVAVVGFFAIAGTRPTPTAVSTEGTRIEAPGTRVQTDENGTRVQAPGVDITVPKDRDGD